MNAAELIAEKYLQHIGHELVEFEPDGNVTPDFLVNKRVAVEVRRLNLPAFASIRTYAGTSNVSVPEEVEDVFSAGFSAPVRNEFKLQIKWGQIQPWRDPNEPPFVQRMRMDAYSGASGSPILDYAGLLVGILFAGSEYPTPDLDHLKHAGYGDKWIFAYNNNAIVDFANRNKLQYAAWSEWKLQDPIFVARHASRITIMIFCELRDGT